MSFQRYSRYKDSGIKWVDSIPAHWGVTRIRFLSSRISSGKTPLGGSETYVDEGIVFLRSQNVYDEGLRLDDVVFISEEVDDQMAASRILPGDVLLNITGASLGRSCIVPPGFRPANVNQHVCVIRMLDQHLAPFVSWCLKSSALKVQMDVAQNGAAREGLNFQQVGTLAITIPPDMEQRRITAFLERETEKIDQLVIEQRRLIALMHEKRQAIIGHAVTKGLTPNTALKRSGVGWLGDVPSHWQVVRNKSIFKEIDERAVSDDEGELLTVSHLTGVTPRSEKNVNMIMAETLEGYKKCRAGDFVINTMWAWMGAMGIAPCDGLVSPSYNVYRVRDDRVIDAAFYDYLCRAASHVAAVRAHSTGVWESRLRLYPETFFDLRSPVPPLAEQAAIVAHLDREITKFGALLREAEQAIFLLLERRTTLISAAVTGKIDVRQIESANATRKRVAVA